MTSLSTLTDRCLGGIERMAEWCASRRGWQRLLAAFFFGALGVLSLPPVGWLFTLPISWTGFIWLLDGADRHARPRLTQALTGWAFGFGYLCLGLYWITAALFTDIGKYWWLVPFALTLLPAALALFWAIAALLAGRLAPARTLGRFLAIVIAFSAIEFLRGTILSGFPWNLPGYAFLSVLPVMQGAALIGSYGMTVLAIAFGGAAACFAYSGQSIRQRCLPFAVTLAIIVALGAWGQWRLDSHPTTYRKDVVVRLVQPNIAQENKWEPSQRRANLDKLIDLSNRLPVVEGADMPNITIWPESAVPYAVTVDEAARQAVSLAAGDNGVLITGTPHREYEAGDVRYFNSVVGVDASADITGRYDKVKLVPFGEFLPLRSWLQPLGLDAIAAGSADFSRGGNNVQPLLPDNMPQPLVMVCYEAIFPGAFLNRVAASDWIVNVTNDAWFGNTAGPYQHFHIARTRAIETGLPLVRVANTGLSGVVDAYGRVLVVSKLDQIAVLDMPLPEKTTTAFSSVFFPANSVFFLIVSLLLIVLPFTRKR